ncbi:MAG: endonuclease/exonuclease/phosphatase family protein [Chloroflexaceae bacterium]|nr:endonuclease/exonuclease/phosphatase family protein [Chloroflexaceae bacterium]
MNLKIISFNIRYDKPDPDQYNWQVRKKAIAALINYYRPDLMGTQEGKPHQLADLRDLLPNYASVGQDRDGTGDSETCAIFYHQQRLNCLETQDFSLSETPAISGSMTPSWGNRHARIVTWATFTPRNRNHRFALFNTHFSYRSSLAREFSAKLICDRLGLVSPQIYLFVTGDFNCPPEKYPRQILLQPLRNGLQLADALAQLPRSQQLTYNNFSDQATAPIDTIYCDRRVKIQDIFVATQQWQGVIPSDHFPVVGTFRLPAAQTLK